MNTIEITVPDIGDVKEVPVVEITVAIGDLIREGDTVVVVETDKATLDIPSSASGWVTGVRVAPGDSVSKGSPLLVLALDDAAVTGTAPATDAASPSAKAPASAIASPGEPLTPTTPGTPPLPPHPAPAVQIPATGTPVYASPSVRQFARRLGVSVADITGTGPKGRILREDVEAFVKHRMSAPPVAAQGHGHHANLPDWPQVDFAKFGPIERHPLSRIGRIAGPALARNAQIIPHVTNFDEADVTSLEEFRKTLNAEAKPEDAKLTLLAFTVKATVAALQAHPKFNASLDGDTIVVKRYWNIGIAADTPDGLVVPVVKDAERKSVREIATEMAHLADAARKGRLQAADMQGATFTISSLGGVGGTGFTPIINAPEVAILGVTRARIQPVWDGAGFQPRLIQPLGLSWDHRVVDGVAAARFLAHIARLLGDFRRVLV